MVARTREDEINPNYPMLAWDGKGTRLAVLYNEEGKTRLFVYDIVNRIKRGQAGDCPCLTRCRT